VRCAKCKTENPDGLKFCNECGTPFKTPCASCGFENASAAKFCGQCGAAFVAPAAAASGKKSDQTQIRLTDAPASENLDGERKTVTTLFADIKGSMDLMEDLDPEDARAIVDPALKLMIDAVHHYDGYVAQSTGDGIFALFGAPVAHEDDPQRALHAALRMQEDLHRFAAKQRESGQTAIEARIGIHTGEVVLRSIQTAEGRDEYVPVGHSIGLAARMQALAPSGSIAVTESTRKLCEGYFNYRSLGPTNVKGVSETVDIYEVTGLGPLRTRLERSAARGLTRFIGRDDEMRTLWNRWEVAREGEGQVVLITGEAGIGKSRVINQFHERLASTSHRWIEGDAEPYFQNTPFHAVVAMVNQAFGLNADQTPDESLDRLENVLQQNGMGSSEAVAPIAQVLNLQIGDRYPKTTLSPEQARRWLLATLAKALFALAASQPMVVVLEDLHWADASTREFLELLVEQAATAPVMVLLTARPEFKPPWPMRAHHALITLGRLRDREVREMVVAVATNTELTKEAIDAVTSRASGVPLFVEELTLATLERGGSDASREIPETLQNSLIARLDRLGAAKEAAQVASVIGREFSYELLSAIAPMREDELQSSLTKLADAELIYARGMAPEANYIFKHALIRDAAYETLLKSRRKELHGRVAQTITEKFPATAEAQPEAIAQHWAQAEETDLAITAWEKAASAAFARRALKEAEADYQEGVTLLSRLPEGPDRDARELKILNAMSPVLHNTRGYAAPERAKVTTRARELAQKSGDLRRLFVQSFGLWQVAVGNGDYNSADALADQMLDFVALANDSLRDAEAGVVSPAALALKYGVGLALAHGEKHVTCYYRGDLPGSEKHFTRTCELLEQKGLSAAQFNPAGVAYASWTAWKMGSIQLARKRITEAVAAADDHPELEQKMVAPMMAAFGDRGLVGSEERERLALRVLELSEKSDMPGMTGNARTGLGLARAEVGRAAEAVELIRAGIAACDQTGTHLTDVYQYTVLAEAQALNGAIDDALASAEKAVQINPQEVTDLSEAFRVRGQLRLRKGLTELAESDFGEAIALSQKMSAKLLELRATTSLARLLRDTNRRDEARAMLAEIYNWFTEGFDTADLKDAKALLDELRT